MTSPRTRRYSRPCVFCATTCSLRGVRDGLIPSPYPVPLYTGAAARSNGSVIWGTTTGATATLLDGVVEPMDWIRDGSPSLRMLVSASVGVVPAVWYSLNGGAATSGAVVTVRAGDVIRWGILPTASTTGSGTITIQNRPEMGTRTYSYTP